MLDLKLHGDGVEESEHAKLFFLDPHLL